VPPHRLFLEKPQVNRRIEYLDPTGPADMAKSDIALAREIEQHHIDRKRELERITSRAYRARKAARREAEKEAS
jgi:hypothetical protein